MKVVRTADGLLALLKNGKIDINGDCRIEFDVLLLVGKQIGYLSVDGCRDAGVPVFLKNSLQPYWSGPLPQEVTE